MTQVSSKKHSTNVPSSLLNKEENDLLFSSLGARCVTLGTAVVQVFMTEAPYHNNWQKKHCGVLTYTKDNNRRSFYLQVFDVSQGVKLFEQEMYNPFVYYTSQPFFHQFEGNDGMVGLNFADEKEAQVFGNVILERIAFKQKRKEERKKEIESHSRETIPLAPKPPSKAVSQPNISITDQYTNNYLSGSINNLDKKSKKKIKDKKPKISKEEIGNPTNFKHVQHMGFDPEHGFNHFSKYVDPELKQFFEMVGIGENDLKDNEMRDFIYGFIESNGGIEKAKQETHKYIGLVGAYNAPKPPLKASPPAPAPTLPARTPSTASRAPPPPPPRTAHPAPPANIHLSPAPPPPKPPGTLKPAPPVQRTRVAPPPTPAPAPPPPKSLPQVGAPPPPPPPPPPPTSSKPVTPTGGKITPTTPSNPAPVMGERGNLLKEIEQGIMLKAPSQRVEAAEKAPPTDSRSELLKQISKGIQLKPVDESTKKTTFAHEDETAGSSMAAMLMNALESRKARLASESDTDDSDAPTSDDEWDD